MQRKNAVLAGKGSHALARGETAEKVSRALPLSIVFRVALLHYERKNKICHPYSSWERGSNENQNGFIRRFIKKGTRIEEVTDEYILYVQHFINRYERAIFKGKNAHQLFENELSKLNINIPEKIF